jgi:hypothetical protein
MVVTGMNMSILPVQEHQMHVELLKLHFEREGVLCRISAW